jgi:hypothetical protein
MTHEFERRSTADGWLLRVGGIPPNGWLTVQCSRTDIRDARSAIDAQYGKDTHYVWRHGTVFHVARRGERLGVRTPA